MIGDARRSLARALVASGGFFSLHLGAGVPDLNVVAPRLAQLFVLLDVLVFVLDLSRSSLAEVVVDDTINRGLRSIGAAE